MIKKLLYCIPLGIFIGTIPTYVKLHMNNSPDMIIYMSICAISLMLTLKLFNKFNKDEN